MIKVFNSDYLNSLSAQAKLNDRLRQHNNIHQDYQDNCQRLFNALEPGSYIRPHRHASDPKNELLMAIRGLIGLITFSDTGNILDIFLLSSTNPLGKTIVGVELPSHIWHTVVALESNSILLEIKAGPFDPFQPKDLATWAPEEGSELKEAYYAHLHERIINELHS